MNLIRKGMFVVFLGAICLNAGFASGNAPVNSGEKIGGVVGPGLKERLAIDPAKLERLKGFFISGFAGGERGEVYLVDGRRVQIARFDGRGKLLNLFLKKGEGPGECAPYPRIQYRKNSLWVVDEKKICRFSPEGKFLGEYRLKNFYWNVVIVDDNRFIAVTEIFRNGKNDFRKDLALFSLKPEKCLAVFSSEMNVGRFFIDSGGNRIVSVIPEPGVLTDLLFAFDPAKGILYHSVGDGYPIVARDLRGKTFWKADRRFERATMSEADKQEIAAGFGSRDPFMIKAIVNGLPDRFPCFQGMQVLPSGNLLVACVKGYNRLEWHEFNSRGEFLHLVELPALMKKGSFAFLGNGGVGTIEETEDSTIYREYGW
jgi:hypothetical protein